jgi:hypothetical protein
MGEGEPQETKQPEPAQEPASPARADAASRSEAAPAPKAAGTMPPATRQAAAAHMLVIPARPASPSAVQQLADAPLSSRTATLDDPLTTSLLAEVARRSRTVDVSPEQIDEAMDIEPAEPGDPDDSI